MATDLRTRKYPGNFSAPGLTLGNTVNVMSRRIDTTASPSASAPDGVGTLASSTDYQIMTLPAKSVVIGTVTVVEAGEATATINLGDAADTGRYSDTDISIATDDTVVVDLTPDGTIYNTADTPLILGVSTATNEFVGTISVLYVDLSMVNPDIS